MKPTKVRGVALWLALLLGIVSACDDSPKAMRAGGGGAGAGAGGEGGAGMMERPPRSTEPTMAVSVPVTPEQGGSVTVTEGRLEGATVSIPAGATSENIEVTLGDGEPVAEVSFPAGPPLEVGPSGTQFNVPVTVEVPYETPLPPLPVGEATEEDLVITVRDDRTGSTEPHRPVFVDRERRLASVQVMHFSTFQAGVEPTADPAQSSLAADRTEGLRADGMAGARVTATVRDRGGAPMAGVRVDFSAADAIVTQGAARTGADGTLEATVRATTAGRKQVRAVVAGGRETFELGPVDLTFVTPAAVALRFSTHPSSTMAGAPFAMPVAVELLDDRGERVSMDGVEVRIGLAQGGNLAGATAARTAGGVATFDLAPTSAGRGQVLRAQADGLAAADSAAFDVTAATLERLEFRAQPAAGRAGTALGAVRVALVDRFGNPAETPQPITLALQGPAGAMLAGTLTRPTDAGVATFDDLRLDRAGTGYRLVAAAPMAGAAMMASDPFDVGAGPAARLSLPGAPTGAISGAPLQPRVAQVLDAFGNLVAQGAPAITVGLVTNPTGANLSGTLTVTAAGGSATFADLVMDRAGSGYVLAATSPGLAASTDGGAFDVLAGAPARLAFRTPPATGTAGAVLPAVEVELQDAAGNAATAASGNVSVALASGPTGAALQGTLVVPLALGRARFADLRLDRAATTYTLSATFAGVPALTSPTFAVQPGSAASLVFSRQPAAGNAGVALAPAVLVEVRDGFGNLVPGATPVVTLALGANPAAATLGGNTATAAAGVASFGGLLLDRAGLGYTLVASAPGLTSATSAAFDVAAGAAARLVFAVQPTNVATLQAISPAVQVRIEDALGNLVTAATTPVTLSIGANPGSAALGGTATVAATGGLASFGGLTLSAAGNGYTLVASASGLTGATSSAFNVAAPSATQLAFIVQPGDGIARNGVPGPIQVEVRDAAGARVTGSTAQITLAIGTNPSGGNPVGPTVVNAAAGVASFGGFSIDRPGAGYTLVATSPGLSQASSAAFNLDVYRATDGLGHLDGMAMSLLRTNANDAPGPAAFNTPKHVALDAVRHRLFVSDNNNHRVLVFSLSVNNDFAGVDRVADFVLGQTDFQAAGSGSAQNRLRNPEGLAYDATNDRLFVVDQQNHRVLGFDTATIVNGENAVFVLGQADFGPTGSGNGASQLNTPNGACYDAATNRLYVVDSHNHRVLQFDATSITNGMAASLVLGQPAFGSSSPGTSAAELNAPRACALGGGRFYVADWSNSRVTVFVGPLSTGMSATSVLGQSSFGPTGGVATQTGMWLPSSLALDAGATRLFVADAADHRVTEYDVTTIVNGEAAVGLVGQPNFTSSIPQTNVNTLSQPQGLAFDATSGRLFVGDTGSNRVAVFDASAPLPTAGPAGLDGIGHLQGGAFQFDRARTNDAPNAQSFNEPADVAIDTANGRAFVADRQNSRVLVFGIAFSGGQLTDRVADFVLGQPGFDSTAGCRATQDGLCNPQRLLYHAATNRLFVADAGSNRVIVYDVATITSGENAVNVLGQAGFGTNSAGVSATALSGPSGLALNAAGDTLFVTDKLNHRVLVFDLSAGLSNGMPATQAIGQTSLSANASTTSASGLSYPNGVLFDATGNRLFVADGANNRVLAYPAPFTTGMSATAVLGQPDFVAGAAGAISATTLSTPQGLALDTTTGHLFVSDQVNNRVLVFKTGTITNGMPAFNVLGQALLTSGGPGAGNGGQNLPSGLALAGGRLWVADGGNHRVTIWQP